MKRRAYGREKRRRKKKDKGKKTWKAKNPRFSDIEANFEENMGGKSEGISFLPSAKPASL